MHRIYNSSLGTNADVINCIEASSNHLPPWHYGLAEVKQLLEEHFRQSACCAH